jgi:two-component system KDP operon response regulator KdpE
LLTAIWGPAHVADIAYLRVAARALRVKLEDDPARPMLIRNEPGIGYRLVV